MKYKNKIKYGVFLLFVTILLVSSNNLVAYVCNQSVNYQKSCLNLNDEGEGVFYSTSDFQTINETFEIVSWSGWAFVESEEDNSEKVIYIILQDENNNAYKYQSALSIRNDVFSTYNNKMASNLCGFDIEFSVANLPDGKYSVYIEVIENENHWGRARFPLKMEKSGGSFTPDYDTKIVENVLSSECSDIKFSYTKEVNTANGNLEIDGWSIIEGNDSENQFPLIQICTIDNQLITYAPMRYNRLDIAQAFDSSQYIECGFRISIPNSIDIKEFKILLKTKDGYFSTPWLN